MCGIFIYVSKKNITEEMQSKLVREALKSKNRGPDNSKYRMENSKIFLAFHRLCINDLTPNADQPLLHPNDYNIILLCNGEIYNSKELIQKYNVSTNSNSDCEIILHLYTKFGFIKTIEMLDGVFACILLDLNDNKNIIYAARDPIGVRSMFIGFNENDYSISSELKNIHKLCTNITQFKPGHIWDSHSKTYTQYHFPKTIYYNNLISLKDSSLDTIKLNIRTKLENAVKKRLMSDREIGCLLSGGLDSSLVTALVSKMCPNKLKTFSIGLKGSIDLKYAKIVANFLGTEHHEVIVTEKEMLKALEMDIYQIETYDTTTIRASTPMLLLSQYINKHTDVTVIYSGEGSDEASGSYLYFHNAPDKDLFKSETVRLLEDLCYFDVLRCDKSTSGASLEVRVPFLDKEFLEYYMNIDSSLKMCKNNKIEKYLLRAAFEKENLLPKEVLWRIKEGMSDGVSSQKRGWYEIIQEYTNKLYTDSEFNKLKAKYPWNPPLFKEALYYREVFNKYYQNRDTTIPYYWLPKWCGNIIEPSARVLTNIYENETCDKNTQDNMEQDNPISELSIT